MKKIIAWILLLALVCVGASAEVDWAGMTDEEIYAEIDNARAELVKRELTGDPE